ncbi:AAA domain-containing protein [Pygmaiobacter massiliensis]|uniref:DEAD/DEAH box helicase n=1 Tax=Pygmaiobacter massiliensis TaxID=1917873 RepID=UPI002A7FF211|nr:AAA domain-containing protein [Pygmaiobacter massiliensis]MDY4784097.1 AAA domain-containing protein [Pygmaiobacter massiliensis]
MTENDKLFFEALHKDRSDSADTFEKPSTREMWRSIVEKYSDQAHFIYELIQNADDAGATTARFILEPERLIFAHNGKRHFSISNPENEDRDSKEGHLGDINAITGIAFSNKKTQENKIGKFGVGFKAVFQYTATPRIYDPESRFRIDRYIVPTEIDDDFPGRRPDETLFVFPFDHKDRNPQETYADIESKLKALSYPILFLTNLLDISFEIGNLVGLYGKNVIEEHEYNDDTVAEKICLMHNCGDDIISKYLWLFTLYNNGLKYSVGFFIDEENRLLPANEPAFCFFPTKETTGLNFLIHAPFLLTDSREGIRAGIAHNNHLISLLAKLAGASLLHLRNIGEGSSNRIINDNIFSIIPIDEDAFCELDDTSRVSFMPFYTEIKRIFDTERIIPTRTGYATVRNAYWAAVPFLTELFSDEQLADICENQNAKWVFVSLGRDEVQRNNHDLFSYIDSITTTGLNEDHLVRGRYTGYSYARTKDIEGINSNFIESQNTEWLHKFYKWLSETAHRTELAKIAPIFLDQDSKAAAAFDSNGEHLILFLPTADISGYRTVREDFLKNKDALDLIKKIGVTHPSIRDQIYNVIIPQYKKDGAIDTASHFLLFFKYYCHQCPQDEVDEFIDEIRDCAFLSCYKAEDAKTYRGKASIMYFPTDELTKYFETKPSTLFVSYDEYKAIVGASNEKHLKSFLIELGVKQSVSIYSKELEWDEAHSRHDLPTPYSTTSRKYTEPYIDGCEELISYIVENKSLEKSVILWNQLLEIIDRGGYGGLEYQLRGTCRYFYYTGKQTGFVSANATLLKTSRWLMDRTGNFAIPSEITLDNLSDEYNIDNENLSGLLSFLSISEEAEEVEEPEDDTNLTDTQREKMQYADLATRYDISPEEAEEMFREKAEQKRRASYGSPASADYETTDDIWQEEDDSTDEEGTDDSTSSADDSSKTPAKRIPKTTSKVAKDIIKRTSSTLSEYQAPPVSEPDDIDEDEFIPSPVDFSRKAELEKEKAAKAIDRIAYQEELQQRALDAEKYSYGWFKALLELEALNSNTNNLNSKEVSISFARVEREPGTHRTLVLKQPNRYIPQFMEDLADIPLQLRFGDQTKTLAIEVANIKSYTLRVKLKSHVDISDLDFSKVTEARIDAKSPVFLLEELRKQFLALGYEDDYDMQENLCENIEFVFGPPGTGKTTHLAKNVLMPLMQGTDQLKVLVLTPTNKSADVLVRRIMDVMNGDTSYNDWLIRFGGTGDEVIEQSPVYRDKTFDIRTLNKNVTVTTIARFPYDFFMPQGARIFLNGIHWDYVVIDEASMIPLVNIIYPLYKKTPQKFIIAGDPFQIEPITSVDLWKNENIYTMVELDSFVEPHTVPHDYKVELLTTQYRSIPSVGSIFSKFAYGGILQHYRDESDRRPLNLDASFNINSLNIIKFPVSKYESIYRSKRLQHSSSYQVYSALFTFEYASYFAKAIAKANPGQLFRIGIIAPYRAQADLIEKLICSEDVPSKVDIQVGTIHGFQGDECDIIFAVFNTPPSITAGKDMFLNKRNIINVSISRAKDYLFIVMPDDHTENINNLRLVKKVEQLVKNSKSYSEMLTPGLEDMMFGSSTYLEDNSFSTGHQSVNVYGLPEKCYEIRSEDAAVDVQIHRPTKAVPTAEKRKPQPKDVTPVAADTPATTSIEFFWLDEKLKSCPFEKAQLSVQAVPVIKKNGATKKLNMLVCPTCKKKYMVRNSVPESIHLSDYWVSGQEVLLRPKTPDTTIKTPQTTKLVHSPKYGDGQITARMERDGKIWITVQFSSKTTTYDEAMAFKSKALIRR